MTDLWSTWKGGVSVEKKGKKIDEYCNSCGEQLNTWDARISKALAYKYPVCEKCIAKEYDREVDELRRAISLKMKSTENR